MFQPIKHIYQSALQTIISLLRGLWLLHAKKKEISFLPTTFEENIKRKSLTLFFGCFVVCLKHLRHHMGFGG